MKVYVDASYDWNKTVNGTGTGKICVIVGRKKPIIEEITISVPGLKQLNNRFELLAIKRGLELGGEDCEVYSDSSVAVGWAKNKRVKWISREKNLAGKVFDDEKEVGKMKIISWNKN